MAIEIMDFSIENCDFPWLCYVSLPEGNFWNCKTLLTGRHSAEQIHCALSKGEVPLLWEVPWNLSFLESSLTMKRFVCFSCGHIILSASGNDYHSKLVIHHFLWENLLFLWPCSIAMWNYQRDINRLVEGENLQHTIDFPIKPIRWI